MMIMINTNHDNEEIDDDDADSAKNPDGDDVFCPALLQCSASQLSHPSENGDLQHCLPLLVTYTLIFTRWKSEPRESLVAKSGEHGGYLSSTNA